jgi:hypothetical protein
VPEFEGFVRRIDYEPKNDYLGYRTYAHVFVQDRQGDEVDVYTEDPRLEAALLASYEASAPAPPIIRIEYEELDDAKKLVRVIMDREFSRVPPPPGE